MTQDQRHLRRKRVLEHVCNLSRPGALTRLNVLEAQEDITDLVFSQDEEDVSAGLAAQRLLTDRLVMSKGRY